MAKTDYQKVIRSLELAYNLLPKRPDSLSKGDLKILGEACSRYLKYYQPYVYESVDPRIEDALTFHKFVIGTEIERLVNKLKEAQVKKREKPKEQEASIPPELETLVAEYRENKALLESEEVKSNSQKTVAAQVKIAIAHSKIKAQVIANRNRRIKQGEKFQNPDNLLVSLGSPKSVSATAALSDSYAAVRAVAFSYDGFSELSPQLQNEIITAAVELNTIGIRDIDTAIQVTTMQIDISRLDESDRQNLATIPGGFISTIYQQAIELENQTNESEQKIISNELTITEIQEQISTLPEQERAAKNLEIKLLIEENEQLSSTIDTELERFNELVLKQTESFKDFEKSRKTRLSDPQYADIQDRIELANNKVAKIHDNLEAGGIKPHLYTPMDDAHLLEQAIRKDMPGVLHQYSTYEAEQAATIINDPKLQSKDLSPQSVLLYSKGLTPKLLAQTRKFAKDNPNSSLGKLFTIRKDIFNTADSQLRKISNSPLGKEITSAVSGLGKAAKSVTGFLGKVSDKLDGYSTVFRAFSDPWGALKSWAGRKAGQVILKEIGKHLTNETAQVLLKNGLKEGVKKLIAQAAAKAAIKIAVKEGTKLTIKASLVTAAQALNAIPGLGIVVGFVIGVVIDITFWLAEKTIAIGKKIAVALYGEDVKPHEMLLIPVAGITAAAGAVFTFFTVMSTATIIAARSTITILVASAIVVIFFYLTSIATAPLISTLVQLDSTPKSSYSGPIMPGCPTIQPFSGSFRITQGPKGISCSHYPATEAVDYATPIGTPIVSITDGTIAFAGAHPSTYGNLIIINAATDDGTTFVIYYAHLSEVLVNAGDTVQAGMSIGATGNSGGWAPHLHLEYRGIPYNSCPAGGQVITEGCCQITPPGCGVTN